MWKNDGMRRWRCSDYDGGVRNWRWRERAKGVRDEMTDPENQNESMHYLFSYVDFNNCVTSVFSFLSPLLMTRNVLSGLQWSGGATLTHASWAGVLMCLVLVMRWWLWKFCLFISTLSLYHLQRWQERSEIPKQLKMLTGADHQRASFTFTWEEKAKKPGNSKHLFVLMAQRKKKNTSVKIKRKLAIRADISSKHSIIGYGAAAGTEKKGRKKIWQKLILSSGEVVGAAGNSCFMHARLQAGAFSVAASKKSRTPTLSFNCLRDYSVCWRASQDPRWLLSPAPQTTLILCSLKA